MVKLLDIENQLPRKAERQDQDYVNLLQSKGYDVSATDLNSSIPQDEKTALIQQVLSVGLGRRKKAPPGIANKAIVDEFKGHVLLMPEGKNAWIKLEKGMELSEGDVIKTGMASSAKLRVGRYGIIMIKENSEISLKDLSYKKDSDTEEIMLHLALGEVIIDSREIRKGSKFEIWTPSTVAAVRGTIYSVTVDDSITRVK